jgi:hypothetical protein
MFDFIQAEKSIISRSVDRINEIKAYCSKRMQVIDYSISRFTEDYGSLMERDPYSDFYKSLSDEYNKLNRLTNIIKAYEPR